MTDHRLGLTDHGLERVMAGALDPFVEALRMSHQTQQLASLGGSGGA